jgi:hypothetical protein
LAAEKATSEKPPFKEAALTATPLRDLGLSLVGTPLQEVIHEFEAELQQCGLTRVKPHYYLSTEWGVPFGTISIAIPFYLARVDLIQLHAERVGHVEGTSREDVLRYLRHEMGHVINYAYRLYEEAEWRERFGDLNLPYKEDYRPKPFSRRFVRHLPGWYAQMHPEEDWAETFAVWMTPGYDWRTRYARWPGALQKLEYCDRTIAALREREPLVVQQEADEDVGVLTTSLDEFYRGLVTAGGEFPAGLDEALEEVFQGLSTPPGKGRPAAELIRREERDLIDQIFQWTGHFPERTRLLLRHMAERAEQTGICYSPDREREAAVALAVFVTALAMNHIARGSYLI